MDVKILLFISTILIVCDCQTRVIIIGVGVAGLTVASELAMANVTDVKILEAEPRIGGRVHTVVSNREGKEFIELGAQWISSMHQKNIEDLIESKSFDTIDIVKGDGTFINEDYVSNMIRLFSSAVSPKSKTDDGQYFRDSEEPFDKLFEKQFSKLSERHHDLDFRGFLQGNHDGMLRFAEKLYYFTGRMDDWGSETGRSFSDATVEPVVLEDVYRDSGINAFYEKYLVRDSTGEIKNFNILLNSEVTNIDYSEDDVTVTTSDGRIFKGDVVVVTISLGVLKSKHETMFTPSLPDRKINAIDTMRMAIVEKAILEFEVPWWGNNSKSFMVLWSNDEWAELVGDKQWLRSLFGFFVTEHQPRSLQAWFLGTDAVQLKDVSDKAMQDELVKVLHRVTSSKYNNRVTDPVGFLRTNWATNPHFLGSYSYCSQNFIETEQLVEELVRPIKNKKGVPSIFFAGEAMSPTLHATVHGSEKSGQLTGLKIIATHVDILKIIDAIMGIE